MDKEKLFKVNFIIQAVITTVAQIVNLVQKIKNNKPSTGSGQEKDGNDSND